MRTRPSAFSKKGVVSSASIQSSIVGAKVLESGGNIVDAAIATSAVLCVTQNNMCGLGGDTFILLKLNGKPVIDLNGSGRAFNSVSIERFADNGMKTIPSKGKDSVLTVPGLVWVWEDLHKRYGTKEVKDLLNPAYEYAKNGFPITQNYSESIEQSSNHLGEFANWKEIFVKDGSIPLPGTIFRQDDLADTIESLISDGLSSFYDGNLADKTVQGLNKLGVDISSDDLSKHESTFQEPLKTQFNGFDVYETAPNSQAATVILWLNMLSLKQRDPTLEDILTTGHIAYSQRDKFIADPAFFPLPGNFISMEHAKEISQDILFPEITGNKAGDRGDTTYFSITDTEGNSISMIQSNYMGFGSGIVPKGTGFVMQNRGNYFSLDPKHHNALRPGKRTFHTLCAGMLEDESGYLASFGSMGGDIQPQLHIQLILGLMKRQEDPQAVIDTPRWAFPYTIYDKPATFLVESKIYSNDIKKIFPGRGLKNIGFSTQLGNAHITVKLKNGVVAGGSDPRGDGISIPAT